MSHSTHPHIGRTQRHQHPRALATRRAILAAFATGFDTDGYTTTNMNTVIADHDITKGATYFHFPSKEAIAQQLIADWDSAVTQAFSTATNSDEPVTIRLRTAFTTLAHDVEADQNIRAGMKLTLDPSIDGAHAAHRRWIDTTSNLVDQGIRSTAIRDTAVGHRLARNLCAGFIGAVHSASILRDELDLPTRTSDMLTSYLTNTASPAPDQGPT